MWKLFRCASPIKTAVKESAKDGQSYEVSLEHFNRQAIESKIDDANEGEDTSEAEEEENRTYQNPYWNPNMNRNYENGDPNWKHMLTRDSPGYKASVAAVLIAPYEENYWFWKIGLMFEKALLAIIVLAQSPSWLPVCVSGVGWLASSICRPYWDPIEDLVDILARFTTLVVCVFAMLIELEVLEGSELWLAVTLLVLVGGALLAMMWSIEPIRLLKGLRKGYWRWNRNHKISKNLGEIKKREKKKEQ